MLNHKLNSSFFLLLFFISSNATAEISQQQMQMLEELSPDQRESVMLKMENASSLEEEIDEAFDQSSSLIKKPELENFEDQELEEQKTNSIISIILSILYPIQIDWSSKKLI